MTVVYAIIVTYRCEPQVEEGIKALLSQTQRVIIVDNGSDGPAIGLLKRVCAASGGRALLHANGVNIGLAAAQNIGIRRALSEGAEWVLLMDQDSLPQPEMVARMLDGWRRRCSRRTGIVGPRISERGVTRETRYVASTGACTYARLKVKPHELLEGAAFVIASGSLVHATVFKEAGLMSEAYFIDGVDHEFCLRARLKGFDVAVVGAAELWHRQGAKHEHRLLGLRCVSAHYSPLRRYTAFRNRLFILRAYGRRFCFLWPYYGLACLWDAVRILLWEKDKLLKWRAALHGVWHGARRPLPAPGEASSAPGPAPFAEIRVGRDERRPH